MSACKRCGSTRNRIKLAFLESISLLFSVIYEYGGVGQRLIYTRFFNGIFHYKRAAREVSFTAKCELIGSGEGSRVTAYAIIRAEHELGVIVFNDNLLSLTFTVINQFVRKSNACFYVG